MEKIIEDFSTEVRLSGDEAESICKLGQCEECCAFLAADSSGFNCIRMAYPLNSTIFDRLKKGTINAKGEGGWEGCVWEGEI